MKSAVLPHSPAVYETGGGSVHTEKSRITKIIQKKDWSGGSLRF